MDMEGATRKRLLDATPVSAINGSRVYWVDRPQASALPASVLEKAGGTREQHLKGFNDLRPTRVQLSAFALEFNQANALMEAMIDALVPEATSSGIIFNRAIVDGEPRTSGGMVGTQFVHQHSVDLIMWWQTE